MEDQAHNVLQKFGIITDGVCMFFEKPESVNHVFFECVYTGRIWRLVLRCLKIHHDLEGWDKKLDCIQANTRGKSARVKVLKCATAEALYMLWRQRNEKTFKRIKRQTGVSGNRSVGM